MTNQSNCQNTAIYLSSYCTKLVAKFAPQCQQSHPVQINGVSREIKAYPPVSTRVGSHQTVPAIPCVCWVAIWIACNQTEHQVTDVTNHTLSVLEKPICTPHIHRHTVTEWETKMQTYTHTHHHRYTHTNGALLQLHARIQRHTVTDRQKCTHTHIVLCTNCMHIHTDTMSQTDKNADTHTVLCTNCMHTDTDRQKCRHTHHHRQKDTHTVKDTHTHRHTKHWQTDEQSDTKTHLLSGLWPTPLVQSLKEAVGRVVSSKEQPVSTQNVALSCQRQNAML